MEEKDKKKEKEEKARVEKVRNVVMTRITNLLKAQGNYIRNDDLLSAKDKCIQMDVVLDLLHFLQDYEENTKVLNDYIRKKRYKEKFSISESLGAPEDPEDR